MSLFSSPVNRGISSPPAFKWLVRGISVFSLLHQSARATNGRSLHVVGPGLREIAFDLAKTAKHCRKIGGEAVNKRMDEIIQAGAPDLRKVSSNPDEMDRIPQALLYGDESRVTMPLYRSLATLLDTVNKKPEDE